MNAQYETQQPGTVLIVDDNPNNLQVLMALLRQAGHQVRAALSGELALRAVAASAPDLILLDVRMPGGLDGYATCARLQQEPSSRDIPVIFISAAHDTADKLAGFRAGCVDYVAKPFQAEEVLARVRTHLQLRQIQRQLESMVLERTLALSESEARYRVLFENNPIATMVFDSDSLQILTVNGGFTRLLGYSGAEALGRPYNFAAPEQPAQTGPLSIHSDELAYTGAQRWRHRDGALLDVEGVLQGVDYAGRRAQIFMLQDVGEQRRTEERLQVVAKEHQRQLEHSAHFDSLTGLPNRALLCERIWQQVEQIKRGGGAMAVCYLDIDDMQALQQRLGAAAANRVVLCIAERLRSELPGGETLARVGGGEFALLLSKPEGLSELEQLLHRLQERLSDPLADSGTTLTLSASIGYTLYPQDEVDPNTLLHHADQAMLSARHGGGRRCLRFDAEGDRRLRARQRRVEQMRSALTQREFILYYQPKVRLGTHEVYGAEALIRWRHPERGLLPPGAFLPELEGDPFMIELGDWVIEEALAQMARWAEQGLQLAVSVNVAGPQLEHPAFIERLRTLLEAVPAGSRGALELEVLETSGLDDIEQIERIIGACRALGVAVSLDDFGTGYSSLTYLRRLSAETLKIDQSFVRDMMEDPGDLAIVSGIIGLAAAFRRSVIAEGVETVAHGALLASLGCPLVQGYGIARPMPAQDMPGWVARWPTPEWLALCTAPPP